MNIDSGRRRFLELAGTGTALSLAGCAALSGDSGTDPIEATGDATDGQRSVAIAVQPDREKLLQRRQAIQSEVQSGNVSQQEAQQRLATAQQELLAEAAGAFEQRASSTDALSVSDELDQFGVLLVSGSAGALLDALGYDEVNAIFPDAAFQRAKSQQQGGTATPAE